MKYDDPTNIRLSDSLLLSDVLGCTSVYQYGYQNRFPSHFTDHLEEGRNLAAYLEELADHFNTPMSIAYGFVSPELSRRIVKYQSPDKPSYHRWDYGAAMDVCFHDLISDSKPPVHTAWAIDSDRPEYSRIITYAESEWICIATRMQERKPRLALYENRYVGERKPRYIRYADNLDTRRKQKFDNEWLSRWRGQGWPSYHGRGVRQYEHWRISRYTHLIDFLYQRDYVHRGIANHPEMVNKRMFSTWMDTAKAAGRFIDFIISHNNNKKPSITKAFDRFNPAQLWLERFTLQIVPATGVNPYDLAHAAESYPSVAKVTLSKHREKRVNILGKTKGQQDD